MESSLAFYRRHPLPRRPIFKKCFSRNISIEGSRRQHPPPWEWTFKKCFSGNISMEGSRRSRPLPRGPNFKKRFLEPFNRGPPTLSTLVADLQNALPNKTFNGGPSRPLNPPPLMSKSSASRVHYQEALLRGWSASLRRFLGGSWTLALFRCGEAFLSPLY